MPALIRLVLTCLALLAGTACGATENAASAAAALKILTQPAPESGTRTDSPAPVRETMTVQRSETLDQLVRRHWAGWPLKDEVLRRALADLNPKVIPNAANNLIKRGSTLLLPTTEDLRRTLLQHYPAMGELVRVKVEHEWMENASRTAQTGSGGGGGVDKRRWVRFP